MIDGAESERAENERAGNERAESERTGTGPVTFREGRREDVPAVVALLRDDVLGAGREDAPLEAYLAAFDRMGGQNLLIVGEAAGAVVACYQLTLIPGLSLTAATRAQVEGVRVAKSLRGQGVGAALMADAIARARAGGAALMQLTSNAGRADARRFYENLGFEASHTGFKRML